MSSIAPTLQLFFTERMVKQLQASPRTVVSYRDTCRLLLRFVADRTGKAPSALGWQDVDAEGDLRLLGPPRSGPAQQRPQPQHPAGCAAFAVRLRRPTPP